MGEIGTLGTKPVKLPHSPADSSPMKKAIGYARLSVSTEASTSIQRQRDEIERWCQYRGVELLDTLEDVDTSGATRETERPGLREALAAIDAGRADVLVVHKQDRLARSVVTFYRVLERLENANASLVSVSENLDFSTPNGRMMASIISTFAQFEREVIADRVRHARRHLKSQGKYSGGQRGYAYDKAPSPDGKGWVLVVNQRRAELVREAAARLLNGETLQQVASWLNSIGEPTAQGGGWTRQALRQMFERRTIYGDGAPAILDQRTWVKVQGVLATKVKPGPKGQVSMLENVRCGVCGSNMTLSSRGTRGGFVYRCNSTRPAGEKQCRTSISGPKLDEYVGLMVAAKLSTGTATLIDDEMFDPVPDERSRLLKAIETLEDDYYLHQMFAEDRFKTLHRRLQDDLASLPLPEPKNPSGGLEYALTGLEDRWPDVTLDLKRQMCNGSIEQVVVNPSTGAGTFDPTRIEVNFKPVP